MVLTQMKHGRISSMKNKYFCDENEGKESNVEKLPNILTTWKEEKGERKDQCKFAFFFSYSTNWKVPTLF